MKIIKTKSALRKELVRYRHKGRSIGFVPTMGYFHEGHLSLMQLSVKENDLTVVSLFVNPLQFGPKEDLAKYPRDLKRDATMASKTGVDILFVPPVDEMYPRLTLDVKCQTSDSSTVIDVPGVSEGLCGASRPGHFRGVATVVAKLINIVGPDVMYMGEKDAQQVAVIKKMVADLDFSLLIRVCPTTRERDGLAMSSRNIFLSSTERREAPALYQALLSASKRIRSGERDGRKIISQIKILIKKNTSARIDYVSIVDASTFEEKRWIGRDVVIALAARFRKARLIDNLLVKINAKR